MKRKLLLIFVIVVFTHITKAQKDSLRFRISTIAKQITGQVGVAIMDLETNDTLLYNVDGIFPMQSVYKFPLALAVLDQVDKGKLSLDQKIKLKKRDVLPNTWSPLAEKYPEGNVDVSLRDLLMYTITHSDNNGCDILFRLIGGPSKVNRYVHMHGVKEMAIVATEEEMHKSWNVQFDNWCKPRAMLQLLEMFYHKKLLSPSSQQFLWERMVETSTGPKRIKGLLPEKTIVAHRTGLSDISSEGVRAAVNDVGIVQLPNGKHFAIVVYVSRSKDEIKKIENVIAEISLAAYNSLADRH
jgi:beta-lactamase class A